MLFKAEAEKCHIKTCTDSPRIWEFSSNLLLPDSMGLDPRCHTSLVTALSST